MSFRVKFHESAVGTRYMSLGRLGLHKKSLCGLMLLPSPFCPTHWKLEEHIVRLSWFISALLEVHLLEGDSCSLHSPGRQFSNPEKILSIWWHGAEPLSTEQSILKASKWSVSEKAVRDTSLSEAASIMAIRNENKVSNLTSQLASEESIVSVLNPLIYFVDSLVVAECIGLKVLGNWFYSLIRETQRRIDYPIYKILINGPNHTDLLSVKSPFLWLSGCWSPRITAAYFEKPPVKFSLPLALTPLQQFPWKSLTVKT